MLVGANKSCAILGNPLYKAKKSGSISYKRGYLIMV